MWLNMSVPRFEPDCSGRSREVRSRFAEDQIRADPSPTSRMTMGSVASVASVSAAEDFSQLAEVCSANVEADEECGGWHREQQRQPEGIPEAGPRQCPKNAERNEREQDLLRSFPCIRGPVSWREWPSDQPEGTQSEGCGPGGRSCGSSIVESWTSVVVVGA